MKNTIKFLGGMDAAVTRQTLQGFGGVLPQAKLRTKTISRTLIVLAVAVIAFTVVACGGGNSPKSLAKQTYQVFEKAMKAEGKEADDIAFIRWSMSKPKELNAIVAKVEALSANDQKAYEKELEKLLEGK